MNDTPRTDAAASTHINGREVVAETSVPTDFARKLERELTAAHAFHKVAVAERDALRAEVARLKDDLQAESDDSEEHRKLFALAQAEVARLTSEIERWRDSVKQLSSKTAHLREELSNVIKKAEDYTNIGWDRNYESRDLCEAIDQAKAALGEK